MKKIIVLLFACLFLFCGCSEAEAENICTVTFDSQGGSAVETQKVVRGEKAVEPTPPEKECLCTFDGWYIGNEKWSFIGYTVTEDMTLVAKWIYCHGMNDNEIEILKGFISSRYGDKKSWEDVDNIKKEHSPDRDYYDYTITFKDGSVFRGSIWCEGVDK